jgi:hypothetical protein
MTGWSGIADDGKTGNVSPTGSAKVPAARTCAGSSLQDVKLARRRVRRYRTDCTPYLFVTDDGGKNFRSIGNNLLKGGPTVHVIRDDLVNPDLLHAGTDVGARTGRRRGKTQKFTNGLPIAPHDLRNTRATPSRSGTHGRSI